MPTPPRSYPYPFGGPVPSLPAYPTPPNKTRCQHCDQLVGDDEHVTIVKSIPYIRGGPVAEQVYSGCIACLEQRLAAAVSAVPLHTQMTLRQARRVITQPASAAEIEAAVQAIDAELKG